MAVAHLGFLSKMVSKRTSCLLSPSQFNLYINDLLLNLDRSALGIDFGSINIPALAYADDVVLLTTNPQDLQSLMNNVDSWCTRNDIEINIEKTKVMHVRCKRHKQSPTIFLCGSFRLYTML